jgi:hypothetical protein
MTGRISWRDKDSSSQAGHPKSLLFLKKMHAIFKK